MQEKTKGWLEYSKRDLAAAKGLSKDEYVANVACYLSQQAAEKAIKAVAEEHDLDVPKVHDLIFLYKFIKKNTGTKLNLDEDRLRKLSTVYINARYPAELGLLPDGLPTEKDARCFYEIAEEVLNRVLNALKQKTGLA